MLRNKLHNLVAAGLLGVIATTAVADDHVYLGSTLGYMVWDDERFLDNRTDSGLNLGWNLGYEFAERFAVEGTVGTALNDPDADLYAISLYNYLNADREGLTPYWLAGLNYVEMDDLNVSRVTESLSAHIGLGLSHYISEKLELRGDVRLSKALDTDGNLGSDVDDVVDMGLNLALNYHFGDRYKPASPAPAAAPAPAPVAPAPAPEPKTRTITLEIDVYFETDKDVAISYGDQLKRVARAMKANPSIRLTLEGHTDSRASDAYNQDLSQRRAESVKAKLVNEHGIPASRIKAIGYGEARPVADNATAEGRAKNRRVVGVVSWTEAVK